MKNKNRWTLLVIMFVLFILFCIFVFFYEKENKEIAVNTYYVPHNVEDILEVDDYKILGIIKSEEEHDAFIKNYGLYEDEEYLNYEFNYVHVAIKYNSCSEELFFNKVKEKDDKYEIVFKDKLSCDYACADEITIFEIPIDKEIVDISKLDVVIKYDDTNQVNCYSDDIVEKKPVLYLYPENDVMVHVEFEHEENLLTTYPKYENSWNVLAKKDGTLIDANGREYYALYWDEKIKHDE